MMLIVLRWLKTGLAQVTVHKRCAGSRLVPGSGVVLSSMERFIAAQIVVPEKSIEFLSAENTWNTSFRARALFADMRRVEESVRPPVNH
jgi:hypothetical protein